MKNAVNSVKNLIKVNTEPSLVENYLEGVTTRVEPKAKAMVIITHSIESNLIEKRSAPFAGDDIVWSAWRHAEIGRNDLSIFGEFNFNMARTAIRNQVTKVVSRFPITIKRNIGANMMNIKSLAYLGLCESAKLASVIISLSSFRRLLAPVLSFISFDVPFVSPVIRASSNSSRTPNLAFFRTILTREFSSLVRKCLTTIRTHLRNLTNVSRVILARIDLAAKLGKTFTTASLFSQRVLGHGLTTDNASFKG